MKFEVSKHGNKLKHEYENDIEMKFEVYEDISKETEVLYDESVSQLQKLCINDNTHNKFKEELISTVSQLVMLKIHTPTQYDDPMNIFDEYQEMRVVKKFQNLKI